MAGQRQDAAGQADGRDLSLALLASRLSELGERVGELAGRVQTAEAAITGQAQTLAEAASLAREVTRLSEAVAGQAPAESGGYAQGGHPRRPVWAAMSDELYVDALRDLARWVAEILLERYRHARLVLPPCWPGHPEAVEELDWLYWNWTGWALDEDGRSRDAADWHDRWLPGVLGRVGPQLQACTEGRGHVKPVWDRAVPGDLVMPGHAPEQVFIEHMGRAGGREASDGPRASRRRLPAAAWCRRAATGTRPPRRQRNETGSRARAAAAL